MKSDVYLSTVAKGERHGQCLERLLAGIDSSLGEFKEGSFVGIKMTVGDEGSTGYIKPEVVSLLVENLKSRGASPFVFDTNVIYSGCRQNAVDHLNLAYRKGFTPERLGCPYIIADGVFGTDSYTVSAEYNNVKELKVPSMLKVLEDLVVVSHVTGHIMSGFAGSMKNVAMGMATRAGKQMQHSSLKPSILTEKCTLCGSCIDHCPVSAISEVSGFAYINPNTCIGCCECIATCKIGAVNINWKEDANIFAERMAEYASGILSMIKRKLFLNFAVDITQECDCIAGDDHRILDDRGIFASRDILAVDKACFDDLTAGRDVFARGGRIGAHLHEFAYAEKIGLGSLSYNLIKIS